MRINMTDCIDLVCVVGGLVAIGYAIGTNQKMKTVSEIVGKSVNHIISEGNIDIPQELIDDTIREQVSKKIDDTVTRKVNDACDRILVDVKTSMYNKISNAAEKAVNSTYKTMEYEAKEQIRKELRNIDISDLKVEVKSEAKDAVAEKLQSSMDDILEAYNSNLTNLQTIYGSIAKTMCGGIR